LSNYSPDNPVEQLVVSLYRLGIVQRAIVREGLAELGSQGFLALAMVNRTGPMRVSAIAERLHVDLSVASRQVAALVRAGYAARTADPDDRRAQRIAITPAGERVVRESHQRLVGTLAAALPDWTEDELLSLAGQLDRLRDDFAAATGITEGAHT
jgi:DNA-binding MarR family transcriptional regulator